ncbi:hypothetical protein CEUSTIGMA_g8253.t1 [Chlamydomonas eustigma]|uniref:DNA/RNA-binding protein Alba-like domain-containing protein n=1 Tax=Chlamydomonas eustigma TaxID=1157962 RepID=A0A250XCK3_9CHLO|nr:hypothetical protein CEUSTIGMA_g8253.t1 [Chlamydomonas eustigma]|eukprot:GAX80818.1 hypothetical protein CEUSTIGMA_g8253.t1 [Chlamydomonas eustigma]
MSGTAEALERHPGRIRVSSSKKPISFYVNLSKKLLSEHGEIQLSALGQAISTLVSISEILKKDQLAIEKKITTSLDSSTEDGRQKPKLEILLVKASTFEQVAEQQARDLANKQVAAAETA